MNGRSLRWVHSKTLVASASVALAFFVPTVASATNLNTLQTVSVDGASMHQGDTVTRDQFTSLTNFWGFTFAWPYSVPNSRAGLAVFRGTFGNLEGGTPVSGVNYGLQVQAWGTGTTTISKQYSLPMLGDLGTQSGTYTAVVADISTGPDMYNKFIEWFATGGAQGNEPNHYSFLTFTYSATSVPEELPGALSSVFYSGALLTPGASVEKEVLGAPGGTLNQYWTFAFNWPNFVQNQAALLMVFRGTFGAVDGGAAVSGVNYGSTVQAWAAGANNFGKFIGIPPLTDVATEPGTYTVVVAERDSKYLAGSIQQEADWFASGGASGVAPRKYSLLTFTLTDPPDCCSSVLFLPGIMGSRLYDSVEKRWEPENEADVQELYLDQNGNSIRNDIVASEVLDTYNGPGPINPDIYKSFLADLADNVADETIEDYVAFAYDWRLSIPDILADGELESQLRALAEESHTGKVTIAAHSNGGLLAKALLNELGPDAASLVDSLVFVAVPQLGTPQAIGALLHGYDSGILTQYSEARARDFAHNAPFAYHLLPHHDYFNFSGGNISTPLATFEMGESTAPFINEYGATIDTIPELERFVRGDEGRAAPTFFDIKNPALGNSSLHVDAGLYLDAIDSSWQPPAGIAVHQIAGIGEQTLTGISYRDGYTSCAVWSAGQSSTPQCLEYFNGVLYTPITAIDGDGTVVTPSALAIGESEHIKRWWVDLRAMNTLPFGISIPSVFRSKHANLLEVSDVRTLILNEILEGSSSEYTYISQSEIQFAGNDRLEFTLHSPLDMWLVDSFGNEISSTTSGISGASYNRYGEVQVITVPKGAPVSLHMQGLELGIFTLEVEEYVGGALANTAAFAGVPTTDTTSVSFVLPTATVAEASALEVDYQSDGSPDLVLEPVLNETVTPDVTPPVTSVALSGAEGASGWYKSSVDVVLTAVDDGSGVRETWYALDSGALTQGTSTAVSGEGEHRLRFYSIDHQGNVEEEQSEQIRIDSVAPEAVLSASTNGKDLLVAGVDALSTVLVTTTGTTTLLTDAAGNITKLNFKKTYSGSRLTYARLESVRYNNEPTVAPPSSFTFIWDKTGVLTSQTIVVDSQFIVQALYDKKKNKTSIVVLKKNTPIKITTLPGLVPIKLTTSQGLVSYSW